MWLADSLSSSLSGAREAAAKAAEEASAAMSAAREAAEVQARALQEQAAGLQDMVQESAAGVKDLAIDSAMAARETAAAGVGKLEMLADSAKTLEIFPGEQTPAPSEHWRQEADPRTASAPDAAADVAPFVTPAAAGRSTARGAVPVAPTTEGRMADVLGARGGSGGAARGAGDDRRPRGRHHGAAIGRARLPASRASARGVRTRRARPHAEGAVR